MAKQTLLATSSGSESMGIINDNFTELYDDKISATQTVSLTNKTIDGDLNTLQDIPYSAIKSTSRSGLDTTLITGTKGATNEIAKFNADGDLITTGATLSASVSTSSLDTEIPTAKAVQSAITAQLLNKEFFVPVLKDADTQPYLPSVLGYYAFAQLDSGEVGYFNFVCPSNFTSLTSVEVIMIPDTTETLTMTSCMVHISASTESYNTHTGTGASNALAVTQDKMTKWRVDNISGTPFSTMSANDVVGVAITSGTTLMRVIGLLVKYV